MEFNETKDTTPTKTTNYEGGEAYEPDDPKFALYKLVINNLLEDTHYRSDEEGLKQVMRAFGPAAQEDPKFPLQLAAYAREEMYLRDISQLLLVMAANETKEHVRDYALDIIQRADEPATCLAIHDKVYGGTAPKPLKKAINDALHQFDAYQIAKYDTDRREVNLRDVLNRTHPKPRDDERDEIFERLIRGGLDDYPEVDPLDTPETWETVISEHGSTRQAWESVLPRMGLFAITRNLRNMLQEGVNPRMIRGEFDVDYVKQAKLYPFRFYQAFAALQDAGISSPEIEKMLTEAIEVATESVPDYMGDTFVAVDLSGSMRSPVSNRSELSMKEIAAFFGAVMMRKGAETSVFATEFETVNAHHQTPTLELTEKILQKSVGGSTNGWKAIDYLRDEGKAPDRVVMLTDMQIWDSSRGVFSSRSDNSVRKSLEAYREEVAPETALYMVDLASYGDLVTPEGYEGVYNISGWNDSMLDFIEYAENPGQIIEEIESV